MQFSDLLAELVPSVLWPSIGPQGNPRTNARPCRRPVCPGSPESPRRPAPCPTSAGGPARRTQARLEAAAAQEKRRLRREVGSRVSAHHGPGEATLTPLILVRIQ